MASRPDLRDFQLTPRKRPLQFVAMALGGACAGALLSVSVLGLALDAAVPGLVAGAAAGALAGAFTHVADRPSALALTLVVLTAGAAGGAAWWFVASPAWSLATSAGAGAGLAGVLLVLGRWGLA
jgi:hypothetical protein